MIVVLICYFFTLLQCQVSPVWEESPYMETKVVYIVDNHQKQSGTYTQNSTFTKPLQNAQVCLCNFPLIQPSYRLRLFPTPMTLALEIRYLPSTAIDLHIS